ncbi:MAG: hypothetical protein AAFZ65_08965, partial [Planctomycetota bacterium]
MKSISGGGLDALQRAIEAYELHGQAGLDAVLEAEADPSVTLRVERLKALGLLAPERASSAADPQGCLGRFGLIRSVGSGGMGSV